MPDRIVSDIKMLPIHCTLVAGAGFSKNFGYPLAVELWTRVHHYILAHALEIGSSRTILDDVSDGVGTLDALLTQIDTLIDIHPESHTFTLTRKLLHNAISACIADPIEPYAIFNSPSITRVVANLLADVRTIITFNWDLVVESILQMHGQAFGIGPGRPGEDWPVVAKLHGSHNWFRLTPELERDIRSIGFDPRKVFVPVIGDIHYMLQFWNLSMDADTWKPLLEKTLESQLPVMVIPSHLKRVEDSATGPFWTVAMELLRRSHVVIVVGYSLPDDDLHAASLFEWSIGRRSKKTPERRVIVIDPDPTGRVETRWRAVIGNGSSMKIVKSTLNDIAAEDPKLTCEALAQKAED